MNLTATRCNPDCVMCRLRDEHPLQQHPVPVWPSVLVCVGLTVCAWVGVFYAVRWVLT